MDIWQPQPCSEGQGMHLQIGSLDLWVRQTNDEWQVATARGDERNEAVLDAAAPPPDADWRRWAVRLEGPRLKFTPLLPDRPVVVRPAAPFQILPGQEARFFVGMPTWVRLGVTGTDGKELEICQEHTVQLSKSWFGTPQEGELCYALKTRARRSLRELSQAAHRAICPLVLRNGAAGTLDFQRLCLRTPHLALFKGERHLWTNEGRVTFKGEEALSHIDYGSGPPPFDGASARIGEAREPPEKGLVSKTFGNLMAFAPF